MDVNALTLELQSRGLHVQRELPIELYYEPKGRALQGRHGFDHKVLVEAKASAALSDADHKQVFNCLRASKLQVALLLHFGPTPMHKRVVWTGKAFETEIDPAFPDHPPHPRGKNFPFPRVERTFLPYEGL